MGITSFTREQRTQAMASQGAGGDSELPPFRPGDPAGTLLFRGLKQIGNPPPWVLDVPGLRPPLPAKAPPGTNLEALYREAVKTRMENLRPVADSGAVARAQQSIANGDKEVACAVM